MDRDPKKISKANGQISFENIQSKWIDINGKYPEQMDRYPWKISRANRQISIERYLTPNGQRSTEIYPEQMDRYTQKISKALQPETVLCSLCFDESNNVNFCTILSLFHYNSFSLKGKRRDLKVFLLLPFPSVTSVHLSVTRVKLINILFVNFFINSHLYVKLLQLYL